MALEAQRPQLIFEQPPPRAYKLNKFLWRLRMEDELRKRFLSNMDEVVAQSGLSKDEVDAVKSGDALRLRQLGAHPLLAIGVIFIVPGAFDTPGAKLVDTAWVRSQEKPQ